MKPIEFITDIADNDYNAPAGRVAEAMKKDIEIYSSPTEKWEVLSYYMSADGHMVLDIERK